MNRDPLSPALARAVEDSRRDLVEFGMSLNRRAMQHDAAIKTLLDGVAIVAACAELPGDLPLRVELFPSAFNLYA